MDVNWYYIFVFKYNLWDLFIWRIECRNISIFCFLFWSWGIVVCLGDERLLVLGEVVVVVLIFIGFGFGGGGVIVIVGDVVVGVFGDGVVNVVGLGGDVVLGFFMVIIVIFVLGVIVFFCLVKICDIIVVLN